MIVQFTALNSRGALVADRLVAENVAEAYAELTGRGLTPVRIDVKSDSTSAQAKGLQSIIRKLSSYDAANPKRAAKKEVPFFTSQMSILLETGTPVVASLEAIERQTKCPHWRMLVSQLKQHVEEGGTLASGMAFYPQQFDAIYVSMISAGESSGTLPNILGHLAGMSRQTDRLRHRIISAMIYPAMLTCIAISVIFVMAFFVLPRFALVFAEMHVKLPDSTKALMAFSDFVRQNIILSLVITVSAVTGVVYWLRSKVGRRFISRNILRIPIFGSLVCSVINARLFRLLGLMINADVPLLESLELATKATRNYLYVELLQRVHDSVLNGQLMYEAMADSKLMPPSISQMIHTGEKNGQTGKVLAMLADYYDDRNETKIGTLTSIMEPIILIVMGFVIGSVAISLVLPLFDLSRISA
jgi:type IV pilus assembly protein PilC